MSTFSGRLKEYPYFSLDRFDGDNLRSKLFFLSHCHQDHMVGLDSVEFFKLIKQNNYKIYVQSVTAHLLLSDAIFVHLKPYVIPLEVNVPYPFSVDTDDGVENFVATLLSAGHCPGSVMFLIEGKKGVVLYTGDIRLIKDDLEQMPALKTCGRVKNIKSIYFDSTFCMRHTYIIPTRNESRDALIALVEGWLKKNPVNKVLLSCAAKYGQEYLFIELSRYFEMKVHIPDSKNDIYSKIPEIAQHVTTRAAETRIHACTYWETENDNKELNKRYAMNKTCPDCPFWESHVLTIKPSMLYFAQTKSVDKTVHRDEKGTYRIKYSSHSSLKEIREIIAYLKPERAYPNVLPYRSSYKEIHEAIKDILPKTPTKSEAYQASTIQTNKTLLTLGKRFKLLERSNDDWDANSAKKMKLSTTPTKDLLSVEATTSAESKWDLWNHLNLSPASTSSTPNKLSQCPTASLTQSSKLDDDSQDQKKINNNYVANQVTLNDLEEERQYISISQKSVEDLFNVIEDEISMHDDSSKDLFEDTRETLNSQNGFFQSELSQALSGKIELGKEFDVDSEFVADVRCSPTLLTRHKERSSNDGNKKTKNVLPINEDLVEKSNSPSDIVVTIDSCDSLQSTQSLRLNDSSSSIEILDDCQPDVSNYLKRNSSSIEIIESDLKRNSSSVEIIGTVMSPDITVIFENTKSKNERCAKMTNAGHANSRWLSKTNIKSSSTILR